MIFVFCELCLELTKMKIIETVNIKPGVTGIHYECEKCGETWWKVDDSRGIIEEAK